MNSTFKAILFKNSIVIRVNAVSIFGKIIFISTPNLGDE